MMLSVLNRFYVQKKLHKKSLSTANIDDQSASSENLKKKTKIEYSKRSEIKNFKLPAKNPNKKLFYQKKKFKAGIKV